MKLADYTKILNEYWESKSIFAETSIKMARNISPGKTAMHIGINCTNVTIRNYTVMIKKLIELCFTRTVGVEEGHCESLVDYDKDLTDAVNSHQYGWYKFDEVLNRYRDTAVFMKEFEEFVTEMMLYDAKEYAKKVQKMMDEVE